MLFDGAPSPWGALAETVTTSEPAASGRSTTVNAIDWPAASCPPSHAIRLPSNAHAGELHTYCVCGGNVAETVTGEAASGPALPVAIVKTTSLPAMALSRSACSERFTSVVLAGGG